MILAAKACYDKQAGAMSILTSATFFVLARGLEADFSVVAAAAEASATSLCIANDQDLCLRQTGIRSPAVLRLLRGGSVVLYPRCVFADPDAYEKAHTAAQQGRQDQTRAVAVATSVLEGHKARLAAMLLVCV